MSHTEQVATFFLNNNNNNDGAIAFSGSGVWPLVPWVPCFWLASACLCCCGESVCSLASGALCVFLVTPLPHVPRGGFWCFRGHAHCGAPGVGSEGWDSCGDPLLFVFCEWGRLLAWSVRLGMGWDSELYGDGLRCDGAPCRLVLAGVGARRVLRVRLGHVRHSFGLLVLHSRVWPCLCGGHPGGLGAWVDVVSALVTGALG